MGTESMRFVDVKPRYRIKLGKAEKLHAFKYNIRFTCDFLNVALQINDEIFFKEFCFAVYTLPYVFLLLKLFCFVKI